MAQVLAHPMLPVAAVSFVAWTGLHAATPAVMAAVAPGFWAKVPEEKRTDMQTRIIGAVHAVVAVIGAAVVLATSPELFAHLYASSPAANNVLAISAGYFAWDLAISLRESWGFDFLLHAVCCMFIYVNTLYPFCQYAGAVFLMYEASTPFLHLRSMLLVAGAAKSTAFKIVNVLFVVTFFSVRLVFGIRYSVTVWGPQAWALWNDDTGRLHSAFVLGSFMIICVMLNTLNLYWFMTIARSQLSRLLGKGKGKGQSGSDKGGKQS